MAIRSGTFSRRVVDLFTGLRRIRDEDFSYITRFTTANPSPKLPELNDFPGLISLQSADDQNGGTEIVAYWTSNDAAKRSAKSFEKTLSIGSPRFSGYLRDVIISNKPWWQRIPVGRWLLYIASLFGAVTVLQTYFANFLEKPDVVVEIPGPSTLKFLTGEDVSFDATITNRSRAVYAKPKLSIPPLKESRGMTHGFSFNSTPVPIAPSSIITVPVKGAPLPKGSYLVSVTATIETGHFRAHLPFSTNKTLQIWARDPTTIDLSSKRNEKGMGLLSGRILVGMDAPDGLLCQVTVEKRPGIEITFIDFPGVKDWGIPSAGAKSISMKFQTSRHFGSFSQIPFEITLDASSPAEDWKTLSSSIVCEIVERRISDKK